MQETDGIVGEHAVRTTAVGDHIDAGRESTELPGEPIDGNRDRAGDVACGVLGRRADVDQVQIPIGQTAGDLLTVDLLERSAIAEIRRSEVADGRDGDPHLSTGPRWPN